MKIYNEIAFDIDGNVIYEDSYEYSGEVMLLKSFDPSDYNKDGVVNLFDIMQRVKDEQAQGFSTEELGAGLSSIGSSILGEDVSGQVQSQLAAIHQREIQAESITGTQNISDIAMQERITQQQQKTGNPMPSMPSISNIGAAPFTGVVNWSSIPGGFQPLPQLAGGKKKLYQLSQFHGGINQKSSPRDISDNEAQTATNVTVSQIGRIKILGDIRNTTNGLVTAGLASSATHIPSPGYGLFIFKSGYSLEATPTQGNYTVVVSTDGEHVVYKDSTTTVTDGDSGAIGISNSSTHVAPVFYVAGGGLYINDANFSHAATDGTTDMQTLMLVYRKDYASSGATDMTTNLWKTGRALIDSPVNATSETAARVFLEFDDGTVAFTAASTNGASIVHVGSSGAGSWDGDYLFYISWIFDNGCETGLSALQASGSSTFADEQLSFNFSHVDRNSSRDYMGNNARIEGARVYFKKSGTVERFLLAEISIVDGIRGALDSTFIPWTESSDVFNLSANIVFDAPPEIYSYSSLNGYYANEVYDKSSDTLANGATGPKAHDIRYRTAVVGANGVVFIGNITFQNKLFADGMMYSMPNKPGVFPEYNFFDSPSSDGTPITALASFRDTILQFKSGGLYVINISNPQMYYAQASFRDCGVQNPCQVFATSFGVIFVNRFGCFIYDGQKVISLTAGKLNFSDWGITENNVVDAVNDAGRDSASVPCVGYDPRSQSIIVLKNIGDDADNTSATNEGAWIYSMLTQSWTEGADMITNGDSIRHSNFHITPNGYLAICQSDEEALKNYELGQADDDVQTITYWTKDLDFGLPSQTKKLFKIYITYKGDADQLTVAYGVNGETDTSDLYHFSSTGFGGASDSTPLLDKSSAANMESWHVATLYPYSVSESKNWESLSIYMAGEVSENFEINDISILYRARPLK